MIGLNSTKLAYEQTKRRHGQARMLVYNGRVSGYQIGFVVPKYQEICRTGKSVWGYTGKGIIAGCITGGALGEELGGYPGKGAGCVAGAKIFGIGAFVGTVVSNGWNAIFGE